MPGHGWGGREADAVTIGDAISPRRAPTPARACTAPAAPLVLRNAWDAASAKALVADAPALATTSVGVAAVARLRRRRPHPRRRGLRRARAHRRRRRRPGHRRLRGRLRPGARRPSSRACSAPAPSAATSRTPITPPATLRDPGEQAAFLAAVKDAGRAAGVDVVLNARVDVHVRGGTLEDGLVRARAYREAGADCVYPIFGHEEEAHRGLRRGGRRRSTSRCTRPRPTIARMGELGVARASFGGGLFHVAMKAAASYAP